MPLQHLFCVGLCEIVLSIMPSHHYRRRLGLWSKCSVITSGIKVRIIALMSELQEPVRNRLQYLSPDEKNKINFKPV